MKNQNWWMEIDPQTNPDELEASQKVRHWIEPYDPAPPAMNELDELYFDQMHTKIMAQVEKTEMRQSGLDPSQLYKRRARHTSAVALWAMALVTSRAIKPESSTELLSDQIYQHLSNRPESLNQTVLNHSMNEELYLELARVKIADLTEDQLDSALKTKSQTN